MYSPFVFFVTIWHILGKQVHSLKNAPESPLKCFVYSSREKEV